MATEADEQKTNKTKFDEACKCGSGKTYGECCGSGDPCACGSGKAYRDCCGAKAKKK